MSRGMPWPAVGVVGGAEACAAAQPATGGASRRSRGAALAAGARRSEIEETRRPLD